MDSIINSYCYESTFNKLYAYTYVCIRKYMELLGWLGWAVRDCSILTPTTCCARERHWYPWLQHSKEMDVRKKVFFEESITFLMVISLMCMAMDYILHSPSPLSWHWLGTDAATSVVCYTIQQMLVILDLSSTFYSSCFYLMTI